MPSSRQRVDAVPREFYVTKALKSSRSLLDTLPELTEEEVLKALDLEFETRRRKVLIDRLIQKAAELQYHSYLNSLKEKYHGTSQKRSPHPG